MIDGEEAKRRILTWHQRTSRVKRWFLWSLLNRDFCPSCQAVTHWTTTLYRLAPDHPPIFGVQTCDGCGASLVSSPFQEWDELVSRERLREGAPEHVLGFRPW